MHNKTRHRLCSLVPRPSCVPAQKRVSSDILVVLSQHVQTMGKPIRLPVCSLSCDIKATSAMLTVSWNGTPVQGHMTMT